MLKKTVRIKPDWKTIAMDMATASLDLKEKSAIAIGTKTMPPPTPATEDIPIKKGNTSKPTTSYQSTGKTPLCEQIV